MEINYPVKFSLKKGEDVNIINENIMYEIKQLIIQHDYITARELFESIPEPVHYNVDYTLIKARLQFDHEEFDELPETMYHLMTPEGQNNGFIDIIQGLVYRQEWEQLGQYMTIASPIVQLAPPYGKGLSLLCLLILDFHSVHHPHHDSIMLELFSLTFTGHIELFYFYERAMDIIEPFIEIEELGMDLIKGVNNVSFTSEVDY